VMRRFYNSLFLTDRLFLLVGCLVLLFVFTFIIEAFYFIPKVLFFMLLAAVATDLLLLYRAKRGISGERVAADRLSNGDENEIVIHLRNHYSFKVFLRIFDEAPHQFQRRDVEFNQHFAAGEKKSLRYFLRPVKRGEYSFGAVNILVHSPLRLVVRRFKLSQDKMVPVYPSYIQMRKYELLAIHHRLTDTGIKKIRRIGHNQEFELIKEYVLGDDFRSVNWKATARKNKLMVNHYQDERSQQVYSLIDKGRVMQMPFNGMTLLDYSINASLVISNIAIKKSDKAGLMTFQDRVGTFLRAARTNNQMSVIQEILYNQKTAFAESDFSSLYGSIRKSIPQRSLLLLYTNFESVYSMRRQLPYLLALNRLHLLVVIFFENNELTNLIEKKTEDLKEIYNQAVAEHFAYDKKLIVKELASHGVQSVLTPPEKLSVNTINKYLELKARNLI
jgi:uncharacterized protein (DUF58 family)